VESFKNNPVLRALAEGRLPEQRPNYDYFAQLLASDALVSVRPKTCWVFVASSEVRVDENRTAFDRNGNTLSPETYPHLAKNFSDGDSLCRPLPSTVLLHEYTHAVAQKESKAAREMAEEWQERFPDLYDGLDLAIRDNRCDLVEMKVTLELHSLSHFPTGSELNGFVEISITQPILQSHRWKCVTRLARPAELCGEKPGGAGEVLLLEQTNEVGVQYTHRPGCDDRKLDCDCANRPRQDVRVPFPAAEWASILSNCANFLHGNADEQGTSKNGNIEEGGKAGRKDTGRVRAKGSTASELISRVAMFQELWSCHPDAQDRQAWMRRAVLIWGFQTVEQVDGQNRPVTIPAGTTWRFLTALDPSSQYHQQRIYLEPASTTTDTTSINGSGTVARDSIMSPTPHYQHQLSAAMSENFSTAWQMETMTLPGNLPGNLPNLSPAPSSLSVLDAFPHGLATPPPTASLHPSYTNSFDTTNELAMASSQQRLGVIPAACPTSLGMQSTLVSDVGDSGVTTDPFLATTAPSRLDLASGITCGVYHDGSCDCGNHSWAVTPAFDDGFGGWNTSVVDGYSNNMQSSWIAARCNAKSSGISPWQERESNHAAGKSNDDATGPGTATPGFWTPTDDNSQQAWTLRDQVSWAQAVSAVTPATAVSTGPIGGKCGRPNNNSNINNTTTWMEKPSKGESPAKLAKSNYSAAVSNDGNNLATSTTIIGTKVERVKQPLPAYRGTKRGRTDSLDMMNQDGFPLAATLKLCHGPSAPAAQT
jgi:transcriptional enhancer factor